MMNNKNTHSNFWTKFNNRLVICNIAEFLTFNEKYELTYVNNLTIKQKNSIFTYFCEDIKNLVNDLIKKYGTLKELLNSNALILSFSILADNQLRSKGEQHLISCLIVKYINLLLFDTKEQERDYIPRKPSSSLFKLEKCNLMEKGTQYLILLLSLNNSFSEINISENKLNLEMFKYFSKIKTQKAWRSLIMDKNIIGKEVYPIYNFVKLFKFLPELAVLSLNYCSLTSTTIEIFSDNLKFLINLNYLSLNGNPIGSYGIKFLLTRNDCVNLSTLKLKDCCIFINDDFWSFLNIFLSKNEKIKEIDFDLNSCLSFYYETTYELNFAPSSLITLSLNSCFIFGEEGKKILRYFKDSKHLQYLNLCSNNFENDFADEVKDFFQKNKNLKKLNLFDNRCETLKDNLRHTLSLNEFKKISI
jgi:hypothetical protein